MSDDSLTMNIPEFAKRAGISRNLAYSLAASDSLPVDVIHMGRRMVLSRKKVLKLLEGGDNEKANDEQH